MISQAALVQRPTRSSSSNHVVAAAYLCLALGIEGKLQHAEYIQSWIKVLKEDKKAIFQAAGHAQKAVDLLLKVNEAEESEDEAIAA